MEGFLLSTSGKFILITQLEVYFRNNESIDNYANSTYLSCYTLFPQVKVERKTERRTNEWQEIKILYNRFEFLVTGGIIGSYFKDDVYPFLGPQSCKSCDKNYFNRTALSTDCALWPTARFSV